MHSMDRNPSSELTGEQIASNLIEAAKVRGDDEFDTSLLRTMSENARRYISAFSWCETILASYFGGGVGGIFAVFFFHIQPSRPDIDAWIWVMVGDIPPAYLPLTDCKSPAEAFRTYIHGMTKWVELARKGQQGTAQQGVPPVSIPATPEWARRVNQQLYGLTLAVKPFFDKGSSSVN